MRAPIRIAPTLLAAMVLVAGLAFPAPAVPSRPGCAEPSVDDKCETWVARVDNQSRLDPRSGIVSADGRRMFMLSATSTLALDTANAQVLWEVPFPRDSKADDDTTIPQAVGLSADGMRLLVGGHTGAHNVPEGAFPGVGYVTTHATIAYDPVTGAELWRAPVGAYALASVGNIVYAAYSACENDLYLWENGCTNHYRVAALDAASGAVLWQFESSGRGEDMYGFAAAPDGSRVFITGNGGLVALNGTTGERLWSYLGTPFSVMPAPDGRRLYVAYSQLGTVEARDAATGDVIWRDQHPLTGTPRGGSPGFFPSAATLSPDGTRLFLTGEAAYDSTLEQLEIGDYDYDMLTVAYNTADGKQAWEHRYAGLGPEPNTSEQGMALATSPDGQKLFVTGRAYCCGPSAGSGPRDIATLAYDAIDGSQRWVARFNSAPSGTNVDVPSGILAMPQEGVIVYGTLGPTHTHVGFGGGGRTWGFLSYDAVGTPIGQESSRWRPAGSLTQPRTSHRATLLLDGRVLVTGGCLDTRSPCATHSSTVEVFDPDTETWAVKGLLITPRSGHTATLLPDGRVLVVGGCTIPTDLIHSSICAPTPTAELYDPGIGVSIPLPPMATGRAGHTATLLSHGRVLVVGGTTRDGEVAEIFDPQTLTWTATGAPVRSRSDPAAVLLPDDGRVLVAGGLSPDFQPLASAELFDPDTGTFSGTGSMAEAREGHTTTALPDGTVLVVGGAATERYRPGTGTFEPGPPMQAARTTHAAALLPDGRLLVVGGYVEQNFQQVDLASAELFDGSRWARTDPMAVSRAGSPFNVRGPTATVLSSGDVLVVGGTTSTSTELFTPPPPVTPSLSIDDVAVDEGDSGTTDAVFTVSLSEAIPRTVSVNVATGDGTAIAGQDYVDTSGTLTFSPGQTARQVRVPVIGDRAFEPDEIFTVSLSNPLNATIAQSTGTGTIRDDDSRRTSRPPTRPPPPGWRPMPPSPSP